MDAIFWKPRANDHYPKRGAGAHDRRRTLAASGFPGRPIMTTDDGLPTAEPSFRGQSRDTRN
jgi:hypothetical protein